MEGYILLPRKFTDWEWYTDKHTCQLFLYLLLKANEKPCRYKNVELERGELVTTYPILSNETGLSIKSIRTALSHLVSTGEIIIKRQAKFSIIAIQNYDTYQGTEGEQAEDR